MIIPNNNNTSNNNDDNSNYIYIYLIVVTKRLSKAIDEIKPSTPGTSFMARLSSYTCWLINGRLKPLHYSQR